MTIGLKKPIKPLFYKHGIRAGAVKLIRNCEVMYRSSYHDLTFSDYYCDVT